MSFKQLARNAAKEVYHALANKQLRSNLSRNCSTTPSDSNLNNLAIGNFKMTKNTTPDLIYTIENLDPIARSAALKAVAHSCMARAFNMIQQQIRFPLEDDSEQTIDKFNDMEDAAKEALIHSPYDKKEDPKTALYNVIDMYYMIQELLTTVEARSKWDLPMEPEVMIDYMIKNAGDRSFADETLSQLSEATGFSKEDLKKFVELNEMDRRKKLIEDRDAILIEFKSVPVKEKYAGMENVLDNVLKHQLGIKAIIGLERTLERRSAQILRSGRLKNISDLTVLKEGIQTMKEWAEQAEAEYMPELTEALENGRSITLVEDIE